MWFVWAILTAVTGIMLQVFANQSFGRPEDYLYCLLWGFGITAVGQALSPATVVSGLGVSLPRMGN